MRSLKDNQPITPVEVNADYPNGRIINEDVSTEGTAVIEQIYQDIHSNIYAILDAVGMVPNAVPDNESTTYQILGALQKLPNVLNDIRQTMSLSSGVFSVPIAIDLLPDGYFLFVKANQAGVAGDTYQFKGTGALTYDFVAPNGFAVGDTVLLIISKPTNPVLAYSLTNPVASSGMVTKTAADLFGSDPFFYLPLSGSSVPAEPKKLTMYIKNGDSDMQKKMVFPAYIVDTRIITGMPNPADWPSLEITLYYE